MNKISKYISVKFFKNFFVILVIVLVLFHLIDYIEKSKTFVANNVPLNTVLLWIFYKLFFTAYLLLPTVGLIASALLLIGMNSRNEIIILRTAGFSVKKFVLIFFWLGVVLVLTDFLLGEIIVPYTTKKADYLYYTKVKKVPYKFSKLDKIWLQANNCLCKIDLFLPEEKTMKNLTILNFDKGRIRYKENVYLATYIDNNWLFLQVNKISYESNFPKKVFLTSEVSKDFPFSFKNMGFLKKRPQEMNFFELMKYVKVMIKNGYSDPELLTGLVEKITLPLMSIIMLIIPIGFTIGNPRHRKGLRDFIVSMLWGFAYWGVVIISHYIGSASEKLFWIPFFSFAIFVLVGYYYINKIE